jgi:hypothetical protein
MGCRGRICAPTRVTPRDARGLVRKSRNVSRFVIKLVESGGCRWWACSGTHDRPLWVQGACMCTRVRSNGNSRQSVGFCLERKRCKGVWPGGRPPSLGTQTHSNSNGRRSGQAASTAIPILQQSPPTFHRSIDSVLHDFFLMIRNDVHVLWVIIPRGDHQCTVTHLPQCRSKVSPAVLQRSVWSTPYTVCTEGGHPTLKLNRSIGSQASYNHLIHGPQFMRFPPHTSMHTWGRTRLSTVPSTCRADFLTKVHAQCEPFLWAPGTEIDLFVISMSVSQFI